MEEGLKEQNQILRNRGERKKVSENERERERERMRERE